MADDNDGLTEAEDRFFTTGGEETPADATPNTLETTDPPATTDAPADPATTADAAKDDEPRPAKTVPLAALHEEREKRKELAERLRQQEETQRRAQERLDQLYQRFVPQVPQQPQLPALEQDPVANLDARLRQSEAMAHQMVQQQQATAWEQQLANHYTRDEVAFRAENPDYDQAAQHMAKVLEGNFRALGITDPTEMRAAARREVLGIAMQAAQRGQNAAQVVYTIAKNTGWTPKAGPAAAGVPTAEEQLAMREKGMQAARAPAGGGKPSGGLDLQAIANMDDDEFDKVDWEKVLRQG